MDILIVSHFGSTYAENDNDRFLYLANMLVNENDVEIVTSSFCHEKKSQRKKTEAEWKFAVTFIDEPGYHKNICIKRFFSHFIFGINLISYLKKRKKPDVIYCAVPSLTGPYLVAKYCQKNGVKFIIDIQDVWPEAFRMVFNVPIISDVLFLPFDYLSKYIYKSADRICAVSQTYLKMGTKINTKCKEKCVVYLGTDLEKFDLASKDDFICKDKDEIWMGYCGTLGSSYDLNCVFEALSIMKKNGKNIPKFIIMGDGPLKRQFEKYAEQLQINCIFTGRLDYEDMCSILKKCDLTVNPIKHGAAASIINKHADYVASALPIVSTQENGEFRQLVEQFSMGYNCTNGDAIDLATKISLLVENKSLRKIMGDNARKCAQEKFDRKHTYKKLADIIVSVQ